MAWRLTSGRDIQDPRINSAEEMVRLASIRLLLNKIDTRSYKYQFAGKKIVSCEEITNTTLVFNTTLEQVKICGDQSNLSGVNHSILHGFNYSPAEVPFPGWVRYGTFFNERNPWWPYFKQWSAYKARISTILQETEAFADIAVLHPLADMWSIHGPQRDPFHEAVEKGVTFFDTAEMIPAQLVMTTLLCSEK
jgi:hypothetical protein